MRGGGGFAPRIGKGNWNGQLFNTQLFKYSYWPCPVVTEEGGRHDQGDGRISQNRDVGIKSPGNQVNTQKKIHT